MGVDARISASDKYLPVKKYVETGGRIQMVNVVFRGGDNLQNLLPSGKAFVLQRSVNSF